MSYPYPHFAFRTLSAVALAKADPHLNWHDSFTIFFPFFEN